MGSKRKQKSKLSQPGKKQQREQEPQRLTVPQPEYEEVEEEVDEIEIEEEQEVEVEVEAQHDGNEDEDEDEEEDEYEEDEDDDAQQNPNSDGRIVKSAATVLNDDEDDEPLSTLLEPFTKDQLVTLLCEVAVKHRQVADRIRSVADEDPVHRKIFVHGLGWDTNAETLIDVFKQYGEIEDCKAVTDKVSGKSKGYAFILFKTRRGARNALKQPQKKIGHRMTACQLASLGPVQTPHKSSVPPPDTATATGTPHSRSASEYTLRKIYVSNVGADLDPEKLKNFFSMFGEIEDGPLGLDKMTGKPKGFCLFLYKTAESAKKALEEPHKNFEGHILHCQKAIDGPKQGKPQFQQNNSQFQRNQNVGFGGGGIATTAGPGQLMPGVASGIGFNQGVAAAQTFQNPALQQALTTLLATQGAGLGLNNLLGAIGSAASVNSGLPGVTHGVQPSYGAQAAGVIGGYAGQSALQGGYPNQQVGQSGAGKGLYSAGQYAPYTGR